MNPLELYLSRVARELRSMPDWKREEEVRELRSHLEQRVEDFEAQGLTREEAQARAVEALGSPKALGRKLCDAWEGVPTSWLGVAAVVLRTTRIWFMATMVFLIPIDVVSRVASFAPSIPTSAYLTAVSLFSLVYLSIVVYCGIPLSFRLGRRGTMAVLALLFLVVLLNVGILAAEDYIPKENIVANFVGALRVLMFFTLPLWLLETVMFRFFQVRRLRNLLPGEMPKAKSNNGLFLRFKSPPR